MTSRGLCQAMMPAVKVSQLGDLARTRISWHPRADSKQNQRRSAEAQDWLNPLTRGRIFAANCQTLQTWPLYVWLLKTGSCRWRPYPNRSLNRTEILHCLNIEAVSVWELTRSRSRPYLNCVEIQIDLVFGLLTSYTLCYLVCCGACLMFCCVPCKKPSLITWWNVTEFGILNLLCNCD